jgi:hypothetical protein
MSEVFEYALVRVVPRVERGEAINAGVIVYSKAYRYLRTKIELNEARLLALDPAADLAAVRAALSAFERACTQGPLAERPLGERFGWLTAPRSSVVQPGPVHGGLTDDPAAELDRLFATLVRGVLPGGCLGLPAHAARSMTWSCCRRGCGWCSPVIPNSPRCSSPRSSGCPCSGRSAG